MPLVKVTYTCGKCFAEYDNVDGCVVHKHSHEQTSTSILVRTSNNDDSDLVELPIDDNIERRNEEDIEVDVLSCEPPPLQEQQHDSILTVPVNVGEQRRMVTVRPTTHNHQCRKRTATTTTPSTKPPKQLAVEQYNSYEAKVAEHLLAWYMSTNGGWASVRSKQLYEKAREFAMLLGQPEDRWPTYSFVAKFIHKHLQ